MHHLSQFNISRRRAVERTHWSPPAASTSEWNHSNETFDSQVHYKYMNESFDGENERIFNLKAIAIVHWKTWQLWYE